MVYVDELFNWPKPRVSHPWCHLWADSPEELFEFALKIGLKAEWAHNSSVMVHFDLYPSKRREAVKAGATEMSLKEYFKKSCMCKIKARYSEYGVGIL